MNSPNPSSFNEPTAAQQGAKEYVRLISEYKALASEKDELLRFLLNIARLLDEDANFAERVKSLEDTKASHKRRLAQIEDLQGEITGRMAWLRRQGGWCSQDKAVVLNIGDFGFANLVR